MWEYYIHGQLRNIKRTTGAFIEYVGTGSGSFYCGVFGFHVFNVVFDFHIRGLQGVCTSSRGFNIATDVLIMVFGDISPGRCNRNEDFNAGNVETDQTTGDKLWQVASSVYRTVRELVCVEIFIVQ